MVGILYIYSFIVIKDMLPPEEEEDTSKIISEEPQSDGSVILKIEERNKTGYKIRTIKKYYKKVQVRKGVVERQKVMHLFLLILFFIVVFIIFLTLLDLELGNFYRY